MIIYHDFGLTPQQYQEADIKLLLPVIEACPCYDAQTRLYRHGFRNHYALLAESAFLLLVCRFRCRYCKKTFTLLPTFLLPRFQSTLDTVLGILTSRWKHGKDTTYRQLSYFYRRRFLQNLPLLQGFLYSLGYRDAVPSSQKERATTLLDRLSSGGCEVLAQKFFARFHQSFMATNAV